MHLDKPNGVLREREDIGGVRKCDGAQERLQMKPVRYFDHWGEMVGEPKGPEAVGGGKGGEAVGLEAPELLVTGEGIELFHQGREASFVEMRRDQFFARPAGKITQFDP